MFLSVMLNVRPCEKSWIEAVALLVAVSIVAITRRSEALCCRVIKPPRFVSVPVPSIAPPPSGGAEASLVSTEANEVRQRDRRGRLADVPATCAYQRSRKE
jgi:hypothetical protein